MDTKDTNQKEDKKITKEDKIVAIFILIGSLFLGYLLIHQISVSVRRGIEMKQCPFDLSQCIPVSSVASSTVSTESSLNENKENISIIIESPQPQEKISSPLTIKGKAKGFWFFEGQFLVALYDNNDNELGRTILKALSDSISNDYVSFEGNLEFKNTASTSGYLKFLSDNPSGLEENQKVFILPINF